MARFQWRRWNNVLHRDLGYFATALTVVYAISGVAVNHRADWNPNYRFERTEEHFEPLPVTDRETMARALVDALQLGEMPLDSFRRKPDQIELYYDGWSVEADVSRGVAMVERPRDRAVLRDVNWLHLNEPKGLWTWVADAYAVVLALLAVTGLFVLKGRHGLWGRGKWFAMAGFVVPVLFLLIGRWL